MSCCEKCYADSMATGRRYMDLMNEREARGEVCTPEQQAGLNAGQCPACKRMTLHQYTGEPMCGCPRQGTRPTGTP
jgi:hypothetical protein